MLFHVNTFQLDTDSKQLTIWHQLTAKTRLLVSLIILLGIVLTPNASWDTWLVYGIAIFSLVLVTKVKIPVLLQRVAIESVFLGVVLIGTLFRGGGDILWRWGWLQVSSEGLIILASVFIKAFLSLMIMNLLTMTTSIPDLLNALLGLRTPPLLVAIMVSMYRYINVLIRETQAMQRAAASRNFRGRDQWQRLVIGNMIGSLFVRTYDRGDRIYQAMLARGYQGITTLETSSKITSKDKWAIVLAITLILIGKSFLLF